MRVYVCTYIHTYMLIYDIQYTYVHAHIYHECRRLFDAASRIIQEQKKEKQNNHDYTSLDERSNAVQIGVHYRCGDIAFTKSPSLGILYILYIYIYIYIYYIYINIYIYIYIYIYLYIFIFIYIYMYIFIRIYIYIFIYVLHHVTLILH